jgi:hypothetical protein
MTAVFADTFYWIALTNVADRAHETAKAITRSAKPGTICTTEEVLTELSECVRSPIPQADNGRTDIQSIQSNSMNSLTVIPEARINERSVPGATSRCCGTDRLAGFPGFTIMTWLPCCRSSVQPAF